jgi:L-glutamine-phosphate cytidylyltransferase
MVLQLHKTEKGNSILKSLILAAGRGSRMEEHTEEIPKCLLLLRGISLLDYQIAALKEGGASDIGIITGYKRELLSDRVPQEFHNPRWAETNMVYSLRCARAWLESESCIVSYGDIFYHSSAISSLRKSDADIAITYYVNWRALWEERFEDPPKRC